jgi:DNA-binding FrmR family transcriptional regulator
MDEIAPGRATHIANDTAGDANSPPATVASAPLRLSGQVRELERAIESIRRPGHGVLTQFAVYRFRLDRLRLAFYAPMLQDQYAPSPLSEGDRVEVIAQRYAAQRSDDDGRTDGGVVLALDNRENGRRYVCHSIFRWMVLDLAPVGYTPRMLGEALYWTVGLSVAALATIIGLDAVLPSGRSWSWLLDDCLWAIALVDALIWVPVAVLQLRWRLGRPTRRQAYTEQVYAAIGFGSALRPVAGLVEL